jgi:hypothetical protein
VCTIVRTGVGFGSAVASGPTEQRSRIATIAAQQGFSPTERRRNRTFQAWGCHALLVLKIKMVVSHTSGPEHGALALVAEPSGVYGEDSVQSQHRCRLGSSFGMIGFRHAAPSLASQSSREKQNDGPTYASGWREVGRRSSREGQSLRVRLSQGHKSYAAIRRASRGEPCLQMQDGRRLRVPPIPRLTSVAVTTDGKRAGAVAASRNRH